MLLIVCQFLVGQGKPNSWEWSWLVKRGVGDTGGTWIFCSTITCIIFKTINHFWIQLDPEDLQIALCVSLRTLLLFVFSQLSVWKVLKQAPCPPFPFMSYTSLGDARVARKDKKLLIWLFCFVFQNFICC